MSTQSSRKGNLLQRITAALALTVATGLQGTTGCNGGKPHSNFDPWPSTYVGQVDIYFANDMDPREQYYAEQAIRQHYALLPAAIGGVGTQQKKMFVHKVPFLVGYRNSNELGYVDASDNINVVLGGCDEVPDALHQMAHCFTPYKEPWDQSPNKQFWDNVYFFQDLVVTNLKLSRGCP